MAFRPGSGRPDARYAPPNAASNPPLSAKRSGSAPPVRPTTAPGTRPVVGSAILSAAPSSMQAGKQYVAFKQIQFTAAPGSIPSSSSSGTTPPPPSFLNPQNIHSLSLSVTGGAPVSSLPSSSALSAASSSSSSSSSSALASGPSGPVPALNIPLSGPAMTPTPPSLTALQNVAHLLGIPTPPMSNAQPNYLSSKDRPSVRSRGVSPAPPSSSSSSGPPSSSSSILSARNEQSLAPGSGGSSSGSSSGNRPVTATSLDLRRVQISKAFSNIQEPSSSSSSPLGHDGFEVLSNPSSGASTSLSLAAATAAAAASAISANSPRPTSPIHLQSNSNYSNNGGHGSSSSKEHLPVPLVYCRTPEERSLNPERINLDRRRLQSCPMLEGEERLKLLNYQNNVISEISNLINLPSLIFLDLYNNRITKICNLDCVPSLRVLMLGKNNIEKIENLGALTRLDVLDLHSNMISKIDNLDRLRDLRVLNLAGNRISAVENIKCLESLTEINLRRNQIEAVREMDTLSQLQRVFLSNNAIKSFDSVECIFRTKGLVELAMDGNPVTTANETQYRSYLIEHIRSLRHLDLKRVTEEERRVASAMAKQDERKETLNAIKQTWEQTIAPAPVSSSRASAAVPSSFASSSSSSLPKQADGDDDLLSNRGPVGVKKALIEMENGTLNIYGSAAAPEAAEIAKLSPSCESVAFRYVSFDRVLTHFVPRLKRFTSLNRLTLSNNNIVNMLPLSKLAASIGGSIRSLTISNNPVVDSCGSLFRHIMLSMWPSLTSLNGSEVTLADREQTLSLFDTLRRLSSTVAPRDGPLAAAITPSIGFQMITATAPSIQSAVSAALAPPSISAIAPLSSLSGSLAAAESSAASSASVSSSISGGLGSSAINPSGTPGAVAPVGLSISLRMNAGERQLQEAAQKAAKNAEVASSYIDGVLHHAVTIDAKIQILNREWDNIVKNLIQNTLESLDDVDDYMASCLDNL